MGEAKVLVLAATGKVGQGVCRALKEAGFDVFGTSRTAKSGQRLAAVGVAPVVCNYTNRADLDKALKETGATKVFVLTDFWGAAKQKKKAEINQGKLAIDACKTANVDHLVFCSLIDCDEGHASENWDLHHFVTKGVLETYLKASGVPYSIVRPACFFENLDDPANYNPLKKGSLKFLTKPDLPLSWCSTYDIGRMAAVQLKDKAAFLGKTNEVIGWKGSPREAAQALSKVSGVPVTCGMAMPMFFRWLFLFELHKMCNYFEDGALAETDQRIASFKQHVPAALDAEGWFRHHNTYADGKPIVA